MRIRGKWLIVTIVALVLLVIGGTVSAMAMARGGMMGNYSIPGMMGNQQGYPTMMGGYPSTPAQQGTPATGVTRVTIQDYTYQPAQIQVQVGTTVTWTNRDNVPHSITFKNGMKDSGLFTDDQSFSYTFTTPGTYQYYCTVHPYMGGTVTVVS